jgi:glycosyltransferase involved in cell wall biosynthesis
VQNQPPPISVFLLIRSLGFGGAQRQLVELARGLQKRGHPVSVGVFYSPEPLESELRKAGIPVVDLRKGGRWHNFSFMRRLRRAIRDAKPDVVYSFVGGANVFAAAVRPFIPVIKLVWSIRSSDVDLSRYDWAHRFGSLIERRLSRIPDLIISNSQAGLEFAAAHGFPRQRIVVVPNGIHVERFRPDPSLRRSQRAAWRLAPREVAVGMLARLDAMKGYPDFLAAAAKVAATCAEVKFVCIGDGAEEQALKALSMELGIADRVLFPGAAHDPVAALNGLDLFCSASITEGFSNSIAEAMACGLPCVVTDVGDSALIVGRCGSVVPRSRPDLLADAISHALETRGDDESRLRRARIVEEFPMTAMVDRTVTQLQAAIRGGAVTG